MLHFFKGSKDKDEKTIANLYVSDGFSVYNLKTPLATFFEKNSKNDLIFKKITNGFTVDIQVITN